MRAPRRQKVEMKPPVDPDLNRSNNIRWFRPVSSIEKATISSEFDGIYGGLARMLLGVDPSDHETYSQSLSDTNLLLEYSKAGRASLENFQKPTATRITLDVKLASDLVSKLGPLKIGPIDEDFRPDDKFFQEIKHGKFKPEWKEVWNQIFNSGIAHEQMPDEELWHSRTGWYQGFRPPWPSAWDTIREACLVNTILDGHEALSNGDEKSSEIFMTKLLAIPEMGNDMFDELYLRLFGDSAQEIKRDAKPADSLGDRPTILSLDTANRELSRIVSLRLRQEQVTTALIHNSTYGHDTSSSVLKPRWLKGSGVVTLRGALWIQILEHVSSNSRIRKCRNPTCPNDYFTIERTASLRVYCNDKCKEQENNRKKYRSRMERTRGT